MPEPLGVALLGCGTVGGAVANLLLEQSARLAARAGRPLRLRHVVVRDARKPRAVPTNLLTTELRGALADPAVGVAVELMGGTSAAREAVLAALAANKDVVTANKALLAEHGDEVFAAARRAGRSVGFEASVAGGVLIIAALAQGLAANDITAVEGILNGTCNFILSAMTNEWLDYAAALAEAQARGYAEADPTLDVDGTDSAHKLAVLARIAFGVAVLPSMIERTGITGVTPLDVRCAAELGYIIKLLAEARRDESGLALRVGPALVNRGTPLADIGGADNAVRVVGDVVGGVFFAGPGAGAMPTASAVVADLIDLAAGRAGPTFAALKLWQAAPAAGRLRSPDDVADRFYLRLTVDDRPGVLAEVAALLAMEQISIASVVQHESADASAVPVVIMTHQTPAGPLRAAWERIHQSEHVRGPGLCLPVTGPPKPDTPTRSPR